MSSRQRPVKNPRKISVWIPQDMREELARECHRLDRKQAWLMRRVWQIARDEIKKLPARAPDAARDRHSLPRHADGRLIHPASMDLVKDFE